MNEKMKKYYNLLNVTNENTNEDIYKAYISKKNELISKQENNELSLEDFNNEQKKLDLAYSSIIVDRSKKPKTEIEEMNDDLKRTMEKESVKKVTVKRGRLIRKIKAEIKKIKSSSNLSEEDTERLVKLEEQLSYELDNHKKQLSIRYKEEFLKGKATVPAIFTTLPKGISLQVKKIANCINELKIAKSNKEKIFNVASLAKSIGMLVATPAIFTAKFVVAHWYLLLLLLSMLPKKGTEVVPDKIEKKQQNEINMETEAAKELATNKNMKEINVLEERLKLKYGPKYSPVTVTKPGSGLNESSQSLLNTASDTDNIPEVNLKPGIEKVLEQNGELEPLHSVPQKPSSTIEQAVKNHGIVDTNTNHTLEPQENLIIDDSSITNEPVQNSNLSMSDYIEKKQKGLTLEDLKRKQKKAELLQDLSALGLAIILGGAGGHAMYKDMDSINNPDLLPFRR